MCFSWKKNSNNNCSPLDYVDGCPLLCPFVRPDAKKLNYCRENIIENLKMSAAGDYEVGASLVKDVRSSILEPLTYIFAAFLETGVDPKT